jgi:hypothetical protein
MKYSDLNQELKQEIFANNLAFSFACQSLAQITGLSPESWATKLGLAASQQVNDMPDAEINDFIRQTELLREQVRQETGGTSAVVNWSLKR